MKIWKKLLPLICVLLLMFALTACGDEGFANTAADNKTTTATTVVPEGELAPLGERAPGEGRPLRDYCLEEGGEIPADYEFTMEIMGKSFTQKDAANLKLHKAVIGVETSVELHEYTWVGYRLQDVLDYLDVEIKGDFIVEATDGYGITFTQAEIDDNIMIAITRNGKAVDAPYYAPC
ncbi:MAG: hypothetical protein IJP33_05760, partial [Firmicutes bacterium]|nr:hypothetical protein [Bacillota bacterium]